MRIQTTEVVISTVQGYLPAVYTTFRAARSLNLVACVLLNNEASIAWRQRSCVTCPECGVNCWSVSLYYLIQLKLSEFAFRSSSLIGSALAWGGGRGEAIVHFL